MTEIFDTDLASWYPKLVRAGVPAPATQIVHTKLDLSEESSVWRRNGGGRGLTELIFSLDEAARKVGGYPVFLRTGFFSGKHHFKDACRIELPSDFASHIREIAEMSDLVDLVGLPTTVWAVREWLTIPHYLTAYREMPVGREFRIFVNEKGNVQCGHPYWPLAAIEDGKPKWTGQPPTERRETIDESQFDLKRFYEEYLIRITSGERAIIADLAVTAGKAFPGQAFSIDFAWAVGRGAQFAPSWWAIDMAEAGRSYHLPTCPFASDTDREREADRIAERDETKAMFGG